MAVYAGRIYPGPTTERRIGIWSPGFLQYLTTPGCLAYPPGATGRYPKGHHAPGFLLGLNVGNGRCLRGEVFRGACDDTALIYRLTEGGGDVDIARDFESLLDTRMVVVRGFGAGFDTLFSVYRAIEAQGDVRLAVIRDILKYADVLFLVRDESGNGSGEKRLPTRTSDRVLEFLGKGLKFPFAFQRRSGGAQVSTATSADHAHIHESIRQILGTKKGERLMRPEFGTRLHELVFEPNDHILYGMLRHEVGNALETWEPRIVITDLLIHQGSDDSHTVLVDIRYRLIASQVEGNMVWPFYRDLE